jgi:hypothetical protein
VLIGAGAAGLLAVNVDFPHVIETLASVAVVWANLAYLFVTVPLLARRLSPQGWSSGAARGTFSLGRWGPPVNVAAVAWGTALVVNTGWPRPEVYGDGWLGRSGALGPTAAMLAAGWLYDRLVRRRRAACVIEEHRAGPVSLSVPEPGSGPRSAFNPRSDPTRPASAFDNAGRPRRRFRLRSRRPFRR